MKKTMNKVAVMAAVVMAIVGYVAGKANTPTTIEPANIIVAHSAIEDKVEEQVEPETEVETEVEKKKEVFGKLVKVLNSDGTLDGFVIFTSESYYKVSYLPEAIEIINERCESDFRYDECFGRFQVTDNNTGRAVKVETYKAQ